VKRYGGPSRSPYRWPKTAGILQHLIDNAVKFTERGTIIVSNRTTGLGVEFSVTDTGIGIPAENLPSIFDIFKQGDSLDTRPFEGVGLGFYIAKKYAELLGSTIEVKSKVGNGSTFTSNRIITDSRVTID
jgi:signal transduction histidine kinase